MTSAITASPPERSRLILSATRRDKPQRGDLRHHLLLTRYLALSSRAYRLPNIASKPFQPRHRRSSNVRAISPFSPNSTHMHRHPLRIRTVIGSVAKTAHTHPSHTRPIQGSAHKTSFGSKCTPCLQWEHYFISYQNNKEYSLFSFDSLLHQTERSSVPTLSQCMSCFYFFNKAGASRPLERPLSPA